MIQTVGNFIEELEKLKENDICFRDRILVFKSDTEKNVPIDVDGSFLTLKVDKIYNTLTFYFTKKQNNEN